jgi:hypothetical protein
MSNEWGGTTPAEVKKVILPNGTEVTVNSMTPAEVLKVANDNGIRRFTVSSDEDGYETLAPGADLSGMNTLYIFPKEKVAA